MSDPYLKYDIKCAIKAMEKTLPSSWNDPKAWGDLVTATVDLICELERSLSQTQLAMLMSIGAMAQRQFEAAQRSSDGGSRHE